MMNKTPRVWTGLALAAAVGLCGCATNQEEGPTVSKAPMKKPEAGQVAAGANLAPTEGHEAEGKVSFIQEVEGLRVVADFRGLKPGDHGFHIHEYGDCSAPDASSAGGHFNPTGMPHGGPDSEKHHLGDLGNITANEDGVAHMDRVFAFLSLSGTNSIIGHSMILHANPDDLKSQPSGNAGPRVACGVIKRE